MALTAKERRTYLENPILFDEQRQFIKYGKGYHAIINAIMYSFRHENNSLQERCVEMEHELYEKGSTADIINNLRCDIKLLQEVHNHLTRAFTCKAAGSRLKITFLP
jgi:hypothetical protein